MCVYDRLGSQRLSEPEFDGGTAVMSKGGWGSFLPKLLVAQQNEIFVLFIITFGLNLSLLEEVKSKVCVKCEG